MKNPDLYGLSLASRLCSIVNDHALSSVDTVLADYLLDHYHELDALNIYAFAEACQVPRSSIHRFCIKLGYANFRDLKRSSHHETDCYTYFTSLSQKPDFREILSRQIVDMIADMNTIVPDALLLQLAGKIHQAPTVCLLSSYSSYTNQPAVYPSKYQSMQENYRRNRLCMVPVYYIYGLSSDQLQKDARSVAYIPK